jgi:hypothetical protein
MTTQHPPALETPKQQAARLHVELQQAQQQLLESEAQLAREQAEVNAFRMHCRLMLDDLVEAILRLRSEKQAVLTRLQLLRQELGPAAAAAEDPFSQPDTGYADPDHGAAEMAAEPLLPTDTPHDKAAEKRLYRELARRFHPDLAETAAELAYRTAMMSAVNRAYSARDLHALYDLAGELEPAEMSELAGIETPELRHLRQRLIQCQRRRRKIERQLQTQRQENTARLLRKAQQLEEEGDNWWAVVRRDLEQAQTRMQAEISHLQAQMKKLEALGNQSRPD